MLFKTSFLLVFAVSYIISTLPLLNCNVIMGLSIYVNKSEFEHEVEVSVDSHILMCDIINTFSEYHQERFCSSNGSYSVIRLDIDNYCHIELLVNVVLFVDMEKGYCHLLTGNILQILSLFEPEEIFRWYGLERLTNVSKLINNSHDDDIHYTAEPSRIACTLQSDKIYRYALANNEEELYVELHSTIFSAERNNFTIMVPLKDLFGVLLNCNNEILHVHTLATKYHIFQSECVYRTHSLVILIPINSTLNQLEKSELDSNINGNDSNGFTIRKANKNRHYRRSYISQIKSEEQIDNNEMPLSQSISQTVLSCNFSFCRK